MADYYKTLDANYRLRIWISTQSQNTAANTSTVVFSLVLEKTGSYTRWSSFSNPWSITVNGTTYSGSSTYDFRNYNSIDLLNSQTLVVPHNADGTKSISLSGSWDDATNAIPDGTVTGTYTLNNIPRASMPRLSQSHTDAGAAVTIYTDRASTAFTHEIQVFFGSIGTSIVTNVADSYVWTIPLSYLNEMPDTDRMFGTIRLRTFSGSTDLGYKDIAFAIRAGAAIVPTISAVTATEATAGLAANVGTGKFVQNITTLAVATSGAAGVYGSTIASTKITVAGQTINAASGTTAPINASGTVNVIATVTDTRGRTASKTLPITVTAYSAPQISNITVYRSTSAGVAQEDGTYVTVQFTASVSSIMNTTERNARSYQIRSLDRSTNIWTVKQAFLAVAGVSSTVTRYLTTYSMEQSFDFEIAVRDDFMTSTALRTVSVAKVFMHWNGTLGLGIGRYHTRGALDVGGDGYFTGQAFVNDNRRVLSVMPDLTTENLNDITDEGEYVQSSTANATTARNYPQALAGKLSVAHNSSKGMVYQTYTSYIASTVYFRARYNGTWYAWNQILTTNTPTIIGTASGTQSRAQYWKDEMGIVHIIGVHAKGPAFGMGITLPVGFRPPADFWHSDARTGQELVIRATGGIESSSNVAGDVTFDLRFSTT